MNNLWLGVFATMAVTVVVAGVTYAILCRSEGFDHDEVQLEADEDTP